MSAVVQLHQEKPTDNVAATLRRIADEIEAGNPEWPVTTCLILLGHSDAERPDADGDYLQGIYWRTYGAGPRVDPYTSRGLLATVLNRWGHDHD